MKKHITPTLQLISYLELFTYPFCYSYLICTTYDFAG